MDVEEGREREIHRDRNEPSGGRDEIHREERGDDQQRVGAARTEVGAAQADFGRNREGKINLKKAVEPRKCGFNCFLQVNREIGY